MKSPGSSVMNCMKGFYYQGEDLLVDKSSSSEQSRGAKDIYIFIYTGLLRDHGITGIAQI